MSEELVEYIAKALVESPDEVDVRRLSGQSGDVIELHVAEEDRGRIIGRSGKTAHAIRTLMSAASDDRVSLEIVD